MTSRTRISVHAVDPVTGATGEWLGPGSLADRKLVLARMGVLGGLLAPRGAPPRLRVGVSYPEESGLGVDVIDVAVIHLAATEDLVGLELARVTRGEADPLVIETDDDRLSATVSAAHQRLRDAHTGSAARLGAPPTPFPTGDPDSDGQSSNPICVLFHHFCPKNKQKLVAGEEPDDADELVE